LRAAVTGIFGTTSSCLAASSVFTALYKIRDTSTATVAFSPSALPSHSATSERYWLALPVPSVSSLAPARPTTCRQKPVTPILLAHIYATTALANTLPLVAPRARRRRSASDRMADLDETKTNDGQTAKSTNLGEDLQISSAILQQWPRRRRTP